MDKQKWTALPCRCGGEARVFGPSSFAPASHWGIYCSEDSCERMAVADSFEAAVKQWNRDHSQVVCLFDEEYAELIG